MIATVCLYCCVLGPAQLPDRAAAHAAPMPRGEWTLEPHLSRAQEFVYRGSFSEESNAGRVQFNRAYRVDTRVFVLDTSAAGASVAFLTTLKARDPNPRVTPPDLADAKPSSVRLEVARVSPTGRVVADPSVTLVPLQGVPTIDCGAFVETPPGKVVVGQAWDAPEDGRPLRHWTVAGVEMVNGASCVKLVGVQESEDWEHGRADHAAWRRQDTVWVAPRTGVANRVERLIERREPAHTRTTYQSVLRYDLESSLQYNGDYEERATDIRQARAFRDSAAPLMADPVRYAAQLTALLGKIDFYVEHELSHSPYREAVLQVKRMVEAARKGEAPAARADEAAERRTATPGAPAPDFLVPNYVTGASARLKNWIGRPILMVFYSPRVASSAELLLFAQRLADAHPQRLLVLGMAVSAKADEVLALRERLKLTYPLLDGSGLIVSYGVEATPRIVLIDAAGTVRAAVLGWGAETAGEVQAEVQRWVK